MTYSELVEDLVKVVEGVGAAIMVLGGLWALVTYARDAAHPDRRAGAYQAVRRSLGRVILLGLEVLIIADIIRTIVVDATVESVAVLGLIVVIRIVLSFSLEVEVDGVWPWQRWRLASRPAEDGGTGDGSASAPPEAPR